MFDTATHGPNCPIVPFLLSELYLGWEGEEGDLGNVAEKNELFQHRPLFKTMLDSQFDKTLSNTFESQHSKMNENSLFLWDII